jgi:hypothetical protein
MIADKKIRARRAVMVGKSRKHSREFNMPSKEKIYECEVKKLFKVDGVKEWRWVTRPVKDAIADGALEFRCKDCHGAVKLHRQHVAHGPAPHIEHKSKQDSEYCPLGFYFRQHPGREPRLSQIPIE